MNSTITVKFQTTIPKAVRDKLGIRVNDAIEWRILKGRAEVVPVHIGFLRHCNAIRIGQGDLRSDLDTGRAVRAEKHR